MNLFLVEDSACLRDRLTRLISRVHGARVVGYAATSHEALEKIPQTKPDVVLLDIHLAQGTGYQVLQQVKRRPRAPIVIVLTNYAYPPYRKKYLEGGADYFFDKSTEFELMLHALQQLRYRFEPNSRTQMTLCFAV
ncbi:MAG: response regulator transcription factor [Chloroflexi bacterium]|nr:response regulator transcription factor [Chloroflexota bacterium]